MPPLNGSGGVTQPANSIYPATANTLIESAKANASIADLYTMMATAICKDGQTTTTQRIPFAAGASMGSQTVTAVADGTATTHAATVGQLQSSAATYLTSVAGTNTVTASATPAVAAYAAGQRFTFIPAATNTGATTINISGLGAKNIFSDGAACVGGELKIGVPVEVAYDGTQFNILGRRFFKQPTRQVLTSGTGATYTTPSGTTRILVRMVGGGGGGGAQSANAGTNATASTFSTLTAGLGGGGQAGGQGGTSNGSSNGDINIRGMPGGTVSANGAANIGGGEGGSSVFGGGGRSVVSGAGEAADTNSGGGGAGAGAGASTAVGGGGGSGSYCEKLILAPSSTYTYTVGAKGTGGAAGGVAGGDGAAGIIVVDEFYN